MFLIATADEKFEVRWRSIIGKSVSIRIIGSVFDLLAYLSEKTAEAFVLDMNLPQARDVAVLKAVSRARKQARWILAGISFTPEKELAVLALGVVACCPPTLSDMECRKILEVVLQKGIWLSAAGMPVLMEKLRNQSGQATPESTRSKPVVRPPYPDHQGILSRREREVADLVSAGKKNKEIAGALGITERTVKAHLTSIFGKLQVRDRTQLIARLIKK